MKQYCRYCSYMCCGDANWCEKKKKCFKDSSLKTPNKCELFEFNPIDALAENPTEYKPRIKKVGKQLSLFEEKKDE